MAPKPRRNINTGDREDAGVRHDKRIPLPGCALSSVKSIVSSLLISTLWHRWQICQWILESILLLPHPWDCANLWGCHLHLFNGKKAIENHAFQRQNILGRWASLEAAHEKFWPPPRCTFTDQLRVVPDIKLVQVWVLITAGADFKLVSTLCLEFEFRFKVCKGF